MGGASAVAPQYIEMPRSANPRTTLASDSPPEGVEPAFLDFLFKRRPASLHSSMETGLPSSIETK